MIEPGTFYPAMIICAAMFVQAIFFWLQLIKDRCNARRHTRSSSVTKQVPSEDIIILLYTGLYITFYGGLGVEVTYGWLVYRYAGCNWDPQSANNLINVFWIIYTVTRGVQLGTWFLVGNDFFPVSGRLSTG